MRHGLTLQTINTLILTILVISIVSFILTKITNPQPINDVGKFYDRIMNPTRTTPPTEDLLTRGRAVTLDKLGLTCDEKTLLARLT